MNLKQDTYFVRHKDLNIRNASRSGGIFSAVSDVFLQGGGVIYGCAINDRFQAEHRRAITKDARDSFRGSKYVQSSMGDCYQKVLADLNAGEKVFFSGTGCQIAGLLGYLKVSDVNLENLLTMDIVCHGTPSPKVWEYFIGYMEDKYNGKVEAVDFRDKKYGWMAHFETVTIDGKKRTADYYRAMFYRHYTLRPSCSQCPYASLQRVSDITIADAWGVDKNHTDFNDDRGCSTVIVNTEKGREVFEEAKQYIDYIAVPVDEIMQPNLSASSKEPSDRYDFWNVLIEKGFLEASQKYADNDVKGHVKSLLKRFLGQTGTTKYIKRILNV